MSAPMEPGMIKSKTGAAVINDVHTDVVCTDFSNKLFIVITQYRKLGSLVLVTRDVALEEQTGEPTYTTRVLFGKDEEMIHVVTRNLASKIPVQKPILFSFAVKDMSIPSLRAVEQLVLQNPVW